MSDMDGEGSWMDGWMDGVVQVALPGITQAPAAGFNGI